MTKPQETTDKIESQTAENTFTQKVDFRVENISEMIDSLEQDENNRPIFSDEMASELAAARLGIASGLFDSIRMKHAPTALHCLRVALGCSAGSTNWNRSSIETIWKLPLCCMIWAKLAFRMRF